MELNYAGSSGTIPIMLGSKLQRIGNGIISGMFAGGVAAVFGAKMAHPSIGIIIVFFAAAWGVLYLIWD